VGNPLQSVAIRRISVADERFEKLPLAGGRFWALVPGSLEICLKTKSWDDVVRRCTTQGISMLVIYLEGLCRISPTS
jgi:hypothetical protein